MGSCGATRQLKSRSLALRQPEGGREGERGKPARLGNQKLATRLRLRIEGFDRILQVSALIPKRVSATQRHDVLSRVDSTSAFKAGGPPRPIVRLPGRDA